MACLVTKHAEMERSDCERSESLQQEYISIPDVSDDLFGSVRSNAHICRKCY